MLDFQNLRYDTYSQKDFPTAPPHNNNPSHSISPRIHSSPLSNGSSLRSDHGGYLGVQHGNYPPPDNKNRESVLSNLHNIISQSPQYDKNKIMSNVTLKDINFRNRG